MQIYQDCLNYLNSDALNRKKYKDLPKLREEILELVEANRSRLREQQSRKTMSISFNKKMVSNDYSNKLSRSSQIDNKSNDEIIRIDSRTTIDKSNTGDSCKTSIIIYYKNLIPMKLAHRNQLRITRSTGSRIQSNTIKKKLFQR